MAWKILSVSQYNLCCNSIILQWNNFSQKRRHTVTSLWIWIKCRMESNRIFVSYPINPLSKYVYFKTIPELRRLENWLKIIPRGIQSLWVKFDKQNCFDTIHVCASTRPQVILALFNLWIMPNYVLSLRNCN